jgi:DNA-binding response OmpR family regulator
MTRISNPNDLQTATQASLPSNGKTIMIAEDDPFIARMYETKLGLSGYKVVLANNGRSAFEMIKELKPNLLLLDINMPELSGFEVLGALAAENVDFAQMPVMVLTNSSNLADKKSAEGFGAEYMIKAEMTPRMVVERINSKLGQADQKPA